MNDEQKNTEAVTGAENGGARSGKKRNRHRGKKPFREGQPAREGAQNPQGNAGAPEGNGAAPAKGPAETAPREGQPGRNNKKKHHRGNRLPPEERAEAQSEGEETREPRHGGKNNHKKNNNRRENRGGYGYSDPYGIPSPRDQQILNDLRAQIVLKAADGSVPAPKKDAPVQPITSSAPLFSSPVSEKTAIEEETAPDQVIPDEILFADPASLASPEGETVEVVGIRFRSAGKVYYFDPAGLKLHFGDSVILETARGQEYGEIELPNRTVPKNRVVLPLRPVLRQADENDRKTNEENRKKEQEALEICAKKIVEHDLPMKLIDVQYAFDRTRLLFFFTSENRVDFRELVWDLARCFHTRIELRQIGIRDEAKMLGGLGACGRPLCCSTFLGDFAQVTIKMAKEQGLSLNSGKISGTCGRLLCCLRYESEVYSEEIRKTPGVDSVVRTPDGIGKVLSSNPLAATVRVLLTDQPDTPPKQYSRDEVVVLERGKKG